MNAQEYLEQINKFWNKQDKETDLKHAKLGVYSEIGEIAGWYKKIVGYNKQKDEAWKTELKGELGDLLYFTYKRRELEGDELIDFNTLHPHAMPFKDIDVATINQFWLSSLDHTLFVARVACFELGLSIEDIANANIAKLTARFGNKFNAKGTTEEGRDRAKEAQALNG